MKIDVLVADESHIRYTDEICEEILISARERGTGIARRTPEYLTEKILAGKAVIAVSEDGRFAGFSYIETWGPHQIPSFRNCHPKFSTSAEKRQSLIFNILSVPAEKAGLSASCSVTRKKVPCMLTKPAGAVL